MTVVKRLAWLVPLAGSLAGAAIWPEQLGRFSRTSVAPAAPASERAVWDEYGFDTGEQAVYQAAGSRIKATAYRMKDSTGALAAFQWQRPAEAAPSKMAALAAATPKSLLVAYGNYLLRFDGGNPDAADLQGLYPQLPRLEQSALPALPGYVPAARRVANSERYILGPVSLERFEHRIPPAVAGFRYGAEAQFAQYRTPAGEMSLTVFSYPTPQVARERQAEMGALAGAMVKRSGPLVAAILSPPDANEAERLLAQVRYQAEISWSERVPKKGENVGTLLIAIFTLTGFLLLFCLVAGMALGGFRVALRRFGKRELDEPIILLRLRDR